MTTLVEPAPPAPSAPTDDLPALVDDPPTDLDSVVLTREYLVRAANVAAKTVDPRNRGETARFQFLRVFEDVALLLARHEYVAVVISHSSTPDDVKHRLVFDTTTSLRNLYDTVVAVYESLCHWCRPPAYYVQCNLRWPPRAGYTHETTDIANTYKWFAPRPRAVRDSTMLPPTLGCAEFFDHGHNVADAIRSAALVALDTEGNERHALREALYQQKVINNELASSLEAERALARRQVEMLNRLLDETETKLAAALERNAALAAAELDAKQQMERKSLLFDDVSGQLAAVRLSLADAQQQLAAKSLLLDETTAQLRAKRVY